MNIMDEPVLILNKGWTAISTTTVYEAIVLVVKGSAEFVDPTSYAMFDFEEWCEYGDRKAGVITTQKLQVPVPEIIVLRKYGQVPLQTLVFSKKNVHHRDNKTCQYCGKQHKIPDLSIDHIHPRAKGGKTTWTNCVSACLKCNSVKDDKSLKEAGMKLISRPRVPDKQKRFELRLFKTLPSWKPFLPKSFAVS